MNANADESFVDLHFEVPSELLESVMNAMAPFTVGVDSKRRCHLLSLTRQEIHRASSAMKAHYAGVSKGELDMLLNGLEQVN